MPGPDDDAGGNDVQFFVCRRCAAGAGRRLVPFLQPGPHSRMGRNAGAVRVQRSRPRHGADDTSGASARSICPGREAEGCGRGVLRGDILPGIHALWGIHGPQAYRVRAAAPEDARGNGTDISCLRAHLRQWGGSQYGSQAASAPLRRRR